MSGEIAPVALTIGRLAFAAYNVSYSDFRAALGLEDDHYSQDKYEQLKELGRALARFDDVSLRRIISVYEESRYEHNRI